MVLYQVMKREIKTWEKEMVVLGDINKINKNLNKKIPDFCIRIILKNKEKTVVIFKIK